MGESKIYNGNKKDIQEARNQTNKRMEDFGFSEGFCVIFNKTAQQINFTVSGEGESTGKYSDGFFVLSEGNKTTFFLVVNLDPSFTRSTSTNEAKVVDLI